MEDEVEWEGRRGRSVSENSQFLSRHPPNGHYHSVKWSQRGEMKRKRGNISFISPTWRHQFPPFVLRARTMEKVENEGARKVFLLLASSLIYSFPHKGESGKVSFLPPTEWEEECSPRLIRWAKCVCSEEEIRGDWEYTISNLIGLAWDSSHAHLVGSFFPPAVDEWKRIFLSAL